MSIPKNHGKPITPSDIKTVKQMATADRPTGIIAWTLGRSKGSIFRIASENKISLHPTNKSPYNRIKKS